MQKISTPDTYDEIINLFPSIIPTEKVRLFREYNDRSGTSVKAESCDWHYWPNGACMNLSGTNALLSLMSFAESQQPLDTQKNILIYWKEILRVRTNAFHDLKEKMIQGSHNGLSQWTSQDRFDELEKLRADVATADKRMREAQEALDIASPHKLAPDVAKRLAEGDALERTKRAEVRTRIDAIRI